MQNNDWCSLDRITSVTAAITSDNTITITWPIITFQGPHSNSYIFEVECKCINSAPIQRLKMVPVFGPPGRYSVAKCTFDCTPSNKERLDANKFIVDLSIKEGDKILWTKAGVALRRAFTFGASSTPIVDVSIDLDKVSANNAPNKRKKMEMNTENTLLISEAVSLVGSIDSGFQSRTMSINKNAKVLVADLKELKNKLANISVMMPIPEELRREYKQKLVHLEELKAAIGTNMNVSDE